MSCISESEVNSLDDVRIALYFDRENPRGGAYCLAWWPTYAPGERVLSVPIALLGDVSPDSCHAFVAVDAALADFIADAFHGAGTTVKNGSGWMEEGVLHWAESDPDIWAAERVAERLFEHMKERMARG